MVSRNHAVIRWLCRYFGTYHRWLVGPDVEIKIRSNGSSFLLYDGKRDIDTYQKFLRKIYSRKRAGVVSCGWRFKDDAHAFVLFITPNLKGYIVDPNGSEFVVKGHAKHFYTMFRRRLTERSLDFDPFNNILSLEKIFILKTLDVNFNKTKDMDRIDKELGIHIEEEIGGYCQPWTYVILLDILCSGTLVLRNDHFTRLYTDAGGGFEEEEKRNYCRLIFMRATMTWIAKRMFRTGKFIDNHFIRTKSFFEEDELVTIPPLPPKPEYIKVYRV